MIYFIVVAVILVVGTLVFMLEDAKNDIRELRTQYDLQTESHLIEKEKIRKDSKFRSSAVNWGKSIEHFVPFMTTFPVPPESVSFLGMPIDYVGFTDTDSKVDCKVHFIEVKSGNSILSTKQKNIKKALEDGRVYWHEIAVDSNRAEIN
jgi:predicted Holliday junction resolvase-like endonuclease